ncbi:MAG: Hsp33 family molecular chaperone HslO, partial [Kiritimatiellae bacterium]|nr:Hsp33 family molecular chaperone HslO [Kiritimatiellia bacterium]
PHAEIKSRTPLLFKCRCNPERAVAMLGALSEAERQELPPAIDVTCHMCGRIYTVKTR